MDHSLAVHYLLDGKHSFSKEWYRYQCHICRGRNAFAKERNINATFDTGYGENLPYLDNSFDFIVSYDVFEHVNDLEMVIDECSRVLRPGGSLLAVFTVFQPLEAHLTLVTKTPALHWIFSGQTLTDAYNEIIDEQVMKLIGTKAKIKN